MKRIISALLLGLTLVSCGSSDVPELEVRGASSAIRTRYSGAVWNAVGNEFVADAAHILDCLDVIPRLSVSAIDSLRFELEPEPESVKVEYLLNGESLGCVMLDGTSFKPTLGDAAYVVSADFGELGRADYYFASEVEATVKGVRYERVGFEGEPSSLTRVTSRDELNRHLVGKGESYGDFFDRYDDAWFSENQLLVLNFYEGSGSYRHRLVGVYASEVAVERLVPEVFTCDMAAWTMAVELDKSYSGEPNLTVTDVKEGEWTIVLTDE